ncbi:MAG: MerR family transcriptional regulator, partial [Dehalococcoidia bacterium]|nr:MerR family transcriptional regulator [Dehalococcoidia bacterium]
VPLRTVRFYIAEGLLPSTGRRGKASFYGKEHLLRLMLIRLLASQRMPLRQINEMTSRLSVDELRTLLLDVRQREADMRQAEQSLKIYVTSLLDRARLILETTHPEGPSGENRKQPSPAEPAASNHGSAGPRWLTRTVGRLSPAEGNLDESGEQPNASGLSGSPDWQRWEIVPGVELQVSNDSAERHRELVEQLLKLGKSAASQTAGQG